MRAKIKLVLLMLVPVVMLGSALAMSNFAMAREVKTNLFGTIEDDGNGCGVYTVLNLVLTVLTYGVGIAATVGLVIAAITYLTAGADTAKIAKAKTRIFEIVIGLLVYAMMWAALNWLIPGGVFSGTVC